MFAQKEKLLGACSVTQILGGDGPMMFVWKHVCGEFGNTTDPLSQHLQHFLVHNIPRVHTLISFEVTLMLIIHDV